MKGFPSFAMVAKWQRPSDWGNNYTAYLSLLSNIKHVSKNWVLVPINLRPLFSKAPAGSPDYLIAAVYLKKRKHIGKLYFNKDIVT